MDVLDVTNGSPDSLWSETHTDVNECRDWCRCRFTLTDEVLGFNARVWRPMRVSITLHGTDGGNGINFQMNRHTK